MNLSKKFLIRSGQAVTAMTLATALAAPASAKNNKKSNDYDLVQDSWIFVMQSDVDIEKTETDVSQKIGKGKLRHVYKHSLKGFSADMTAEEAKEIADTTPGVAYVVPNSYVYVMGVAKQTSKKPPASQQVVPYGVVRVGGGQYKGNATAWVVDSGVDSRHPDLRVHKGKSTSVIDNSRGLVDGTGHGTHVAGIIGARDNDIGVVGVAPGVTIASIKVLDDEGKGTADSVIAGLDYAASKARRGDVINLSLAGGYNQAINDAVDRASQSAPVIIAAGNYRKDARNYSPSSADGPNIMTISAIDQGDVYSSSSNFGNPPIDCAAPGVDVYSTLPGGNYGTFTGTSMAAPHVSGLVLKGNVSFDGSVYNDPDGTPDKVCVF